MQNGELSISDYNKNKPRRLQWDFVGILGQVAGSNAPGSETRHHWPIQAPEHPIGDRQGTDYFWTVHSLQICRYKIIHVFPCVENILPLRVSTTTQLKGPR